MKRSFSRLTLVALAAMALGSLAPMSSATADEVEGTTCSSNTGLAKLSPGLGESAKVQNITVKGTLSECTGSAGSSAKYVVHVKSTTALSCASVIGEGAVAEGTSTLKWGHGHGNSLSTLTVSGNLVSGFNLGGVVEEGPYAGLSISGTVSGTPVFSGKGEPCSKKNRLKQIEVAGTSPFVIS